MKKSNKILLFGLLASILLIVFCLYTHQELFMNQEKTSIIESKNNDEPLADTSKIEPIVELKDEKSKPVKQVSMEVPKNLATVQQVAEENSSKSMDKNSTELEENRSNRVVPRTIFKNKEEIKLKVHPKVEPKKEKVNVVDTNLPIEDNKPLVDNDKKVSKVTETVKKKEKVASKKVATKSKVTKKNKEKVSTNTKSLATLQEEISNITNRNISFYKSKAQITDKSRVTLDKVIEILKTVPNAKIVVKGYTDASGEEKTNLWISQERAKSVKRYLAKHGIPLKNIVAKGYGESELLYGDKPNSELNRRVEIEIKRK
jgi:outer membrane protein OmpA-like peptidoglycan-associated protein